MVYTQRRNAKLMFLMILIVWLLAAIISIPPLFGWGKPSARLEKDKTCAVSSDLQYQIFATFFAFYFPLIVMIIIYINIYRAAKKIKKREMETAGRLQYSHHAATMPSISYSHHTTPDSLNNLKQSQLEPLIGQKTNAAQLQHQHSVQSNPNYNYNVKNSTSSGVSVPSNLYNSQHYQNSNYMQQQQQQAPLPHNRSNLNQLLRRGKKAKLLQQQQQQQQQLYNDTQQQQMIATLKKSASESEDGSIESKIYHSSASSQENFNSSQMVKESSILNQMMLVVSSSSSSNQAAHVTVAKTASIANASISRRSSFGKRFGRRLTQAFSGLKRPSGTSLVQGKNQKATRTLGIIMGCFIICWLPFFILAVVKPIPIMNGKRIVDYIPKWLDSLLLWLGYVNSALNPMIYARFNREFRQPFLEILCFRCRGINDKLRDEERKKLLNDFSTTNHMHSTTSAVQFRSSYMKQASSGGVNAAGYLTTTYNTIINSGKHPHFQDGSSSYHSLDKHLNQQDLIEANEEPSVVTAQEDDDFSKQQIIKNNEKTSANNRIERDKDKNEEKPVLGMHDYRKQIEEQKNKFFFGTSHPPYDNNNNSIDYGLVDGLVDDSIANKKLDLDKVALVDNRKANYILDAIIQAEIKTDFIMLNSVFEHEQAHHHQQPEYQHRNKYETDEFNGKSSPCMGFESANESIEDQLGVDDDDDENGLDVYENEEDRCGHGSVGFKLNDLTIYAAVYEHRSSNDDTIRQEQETTAMVDTTGDEDFSTPSAISPDLRLALALNSAASPSSLPFTGPYTKKRNNPKLHNEIEKKLNRLNNQQSNNKHSHRKQQQQRQQRQQQQNDKRKLNNSSTKSSIFTSDSFNTFESSSSLFDRSAGNAQKSRPFSSTNTKSSSSNNDDYSPNSSSSQMNKDCSSTEANEKLQDVEQVNPIKSDNKTKNSSIHSIPYSSVYSFKTAPTSPVNVVLTSKDLADAADNDSIGFLEQQQDSNLIAQHSEDELDDAANNALLVKNRQRKLLNLSNTKHQSIDQAPFSIKNSKESPASSALVAAETVPAHEQSDRLEDQRSHLAFPLAYYSHANKKAYSSSVDSSSSSSSLTYAAAPAVTPPIRNINTNSNNNRKNDPLYTKSNLPAESPNLLDRSLKNNLCIESNNNPIGEQAANNSSVKSNKDKQLKEDNKTKSIETATSETSV
jgi:hypothetical protein